MDREAQRAQLFERAAVAKVNEVFAKDKSKGARRKSAAQAGLSRPEVIDMLLKMHDGVLTSISLSLDGDENSEAYISFRILSAQEELDIKKEMADSGLLPDCDGAYELLLVAKKLSRASSLVQNPLPADLNSQPLLSESELLNMLSKFQLLALGYKYDEFLKKHSPKPREYSEEELQSIIDEISEVLSLDPKHHIAELRKIFFDLDLNATQGAIIKCVISLKTITQQMDKLAIG